MEPVWPWIVEQLAGAMEEATVIWLVQLNQR
jgi:hypothetical protein